MGNHATTEHTEYTEARHTRWDDSFPCVRRVPWLKNRIAAQAQVQLPNWVDPFLLVKDTRRILEAVS
jgi:hypothetical protein